MSDKLYDFEEDYRDYYKQMEKAKKIVDRFPNHKTIFEIDNDCHLCYKTNYK